MFKHILVPTDGSTLSQDTVARAVTFARDAGARITFFCAERHFPAIYLGVGAVADAHATTDFHQAEEAIANGILADCERQATAAGVPCSILTIVSEEPYEAIIDAATRSACDLIFMASHGRRGLKALLLGSETHKVLTHSTIPVLVYR